MVRQILHDKGVIAKIFFLKELAPERLTVSAGLALFSIYISSIAVGV